jgi:catechol 2,3-dioxygenase-like lactoylglutathione lyase family enzyme
MKQIIENLVNDFERGKLSRRQLVEALAIGAVTAGAMPIGLAGAARAAERLPLKANGINHIVYEVPDYARTRDFYADLLGMTVSEDTGKQCYLRFANTLLTARTFRQPTPKPFVNHICYSLADWDENAVEMELTRRGLAPRTDMGGGAKSFHIRDPDGYDVQIAPPLL